MSNPALTSRQREIYEFLKDKIINRGYGPTVREIGTHFRIRSPNGVMCHLKALEKKGLILREQQKSRAIQLAEKPAEHVALVSAARIVLERCSVTSYEEQVAHSLLAKALEPFGGVEP